VTYPLAVSIAVLAVIGLDLGLTRIRLITRAAFWVSYAIILAFQLIVNGVLTGVPVVRYRPSAIVGLRIAYAPVEDLLFGFCLVLSTLTIWVWLGRRTGSGRRDRVARVIHEPTRPGPATAARPANPTDTRREKTS
jgi:lycopene cyclase domain-containing protein